MSKLLLLDLFFSQLDHFYVNTLVAIMLPWHQFKFYTLSSKNTWHELTGGWSPAINTGHMCHFRVNNWNKIWSEAWSISTTANVLLICLHWRATIFMFVFDLTESSQNFPVFFLDWHSLSKNLSCTTRLMHELILTEREREEMGLRSKRVLHGSRWVGSGERWGGGRGGKD